jgi:hypothetical protein
MTESSHDEHRPPVGQDPVQAAVDMPDLMGHLYPVGDILAVIDNRADVDRLLQELKEEAGVPEGDVDLVDGMWFAQVMRAKKESWNPVQRGLAWLAAEEGAVVRDYVQQADQGHNIVLVHAEQPELWASIARLLKAYGAHHIRHYGSLVMTTL